MTIETILPIPNIFEAKRILCVQPHYDDNDMAVAGIFTQLAKRGAELIYLTVTDDLMGISDVSLSDEAAAQALRTHIENISDTLLEITSVQDLDDYEQELTGLMRKYGVADSSVSGDIDWRRQRLFEREDGGEPAYTQHARPVTSEISDNQIRSMFSGLLKSK